MKGQLLTDKQMAAIRGVAETGMHVDVSIRHRLPFVSDESNPFGDDDVKRDPVYSEHHCQGWLLNIVNRTLEIDTVMLVQDSNYTLRIPSTVPIETGDEVWIEGQRYAVMGTNDGESYRVWNIAALVKII